MLAKVAISKALLLLIVILMPGLSACRWSWKEAAPCTPDRQVHFVRFDRTVDDFVRTGNLSFSQRLSTDYATEMRLLVENVLHLGSVEDPDVYKKLRTYFADSSLTHLSADVGRRYADLHLYEQQLACALTYLSRELPDLKMPYIYTQVSALNQSIVVDDTVVGVSLDKYLGADYPLYAKTYTAAQRATMTPERIVPDVLSFYLAAQYPPRTRPKNLREVMIEVGRMKWVVARAMRVSTEAACGFSAPAAQWLRRNEKALWQTLQSRGVFDTDDRATIRRLNALTEERPYFNDPRSRGAGTWFGVKIVAAFMERHPECSVEQLLLHTSAATIWRESGFKL